VAGAAILLIILFLVFRAYRMKRRASALMEREKMHVEEKNKNIVDSIQYAQQLQQAILPPIENIRQTFHESFLIYWPKDIVAGDFYWLMEDDHYKLWAVADCTGHGVPGAMVSVVCSNALNRATKEKGLRVPGVILDEVRTLVIDTFKESQREVKDGMDIALCVYHKSTQTYQFAGANRPLWCLKKSGELIEIKGNKQAIGFQHQMEPFSTTPVPALHGDSIYLMTDGFVDQFGGPNAKKYMASRLKLKLNEIATQPFDLQKMNLEWEFNQWKGDQEQIDDVCILAIKCF
jgi:serine phosphatase RsbU (regulator of sigma subunit)